MPVVLAPVGLTGMQYADGEIKAAKAAEKFGVPYTLSTMSICSIEDVAENVSQPFWFQLYTMNDDAFTKQLIDRAKAAGCSTLVITLDLQTLGQRHKDLKNGLSAPPKLTLSSIADLSTRWRWGLGMLGTKRRMFGNIVGHVDGIKDPADLAAWTGDRFDLTLDWEKVAKIRDWWGGKVILKGILDVED
ncbi:MAG: alpha-hydroxy acid oxidase, partial [Paracoccaceae bacterium]